MRYMKKRFVAAVVLLIYIAILLKVLVFKDLPTVHIGHLMLNFGGVDAGHPANFIPFKTIAPYLLGYKGWIIAGINLLGNIILLVPVGFLLPFLYPNVSWKKSLVFGVIAGLSLEVLQVILRVGIFDIDDVMLNALGVMIGCWKYAATTRLLSSKYRIPTIGLILVIITALMYVIIVNPGVRLSAAPHVFPPVGVACYDSFESVVQSGYADPDMNLPPFELKDVTQFRCTSSKGFEQYEIAGTDRGGHSFYVQHASGGTAASGADGYLDHCYKRDGVIIQSVKIVGRAGASEPGSCVFDDRLPENADSRYDFSR